MKDNRLIQCTQEAGLCSSGLLHRQNPRSWTAETSRENTDFNILSPGPVEALKRWAPGREMRPESYPIH